MRRWLKALALCLAPGVALAAPPAAPQTVISLNGAPPLTQALPYANPNAPKGGSLTLAAQGSFDNLNPFILRGTAPDSVFRIWQPLFKLSDTDSETEYADLAQSVSVAGRQVTFHLNPAARFSDGTPVTAHDVAWTYKTLISQGAPFYAAEYADVAGVTARDARDVTFTLKPGAGPQTLFNLAAMYILPAHFWAGRDFAAPLRAAPPGSGAYQIGAVQWGASISYTHVPHWWAQDLPANRGCDNFSRITQLFFQDEAAARQAFKAGLVDVRVEGSPALWRAAHRWAAVRRGQVRLDNAPLTLPASMRGLVMNTRIPPFSNPGVREALSLVFDFQWINRVLLGGNDARDDSYFGPAPHGAPALPVTDGSGQETAQLTQALTILRAAGWRMRHMRLVNAAGQPLRLDILLDNPADERFVLPYIEHLAQLGIEARISLADPATYHARLRRFDFGMALASFPESAAPGSELYGYWGCAAARIPGSYNLAGLCNPEIEADIRAVLTAATSTARQAALAALNLRLLRGFYVVPWFHPVAQHLEYWQDRVAKPAAPVMMGHDISLWWAR